MVFCTPKAFSCGFLFWGGEHVFVLCLEGGFREMNFILRFIFVFSFLWGGVFQVRNGGSWRASALKEGLQGAERVALKDVKGLQGGFKGSFTGASRGALKGASRGKGAQRAHKRGAQRGGGGFKGASKQF